MKLLRWLFGRSRSPRGLHYGEEAARWAEGYYPKAMQPVAAYVVDLLCVHAGRPISGIKPGMYFVDDLGMDDLEPVEFLLAIEEGLSVKIEEEEAKYLQTVAVLIEYLGERLVETGMV